MIVPREWQIPSKILLIEDDILSVRSLLATAYIIYIQHLFPNSIDKKVFVFIFEECACVISKLNRKERNITQMLQCM